MGNNVIETENMSGSQGEVSMDDGMSFAQLFEESLIKVANVGEVVQGTVIDITKDYAVIDIGDKSESTLR